MLAEISSPADDASRAGTRRTVAVILCSSDPFLFSPCDSPPKIAGAALAGACN